MDEDFVVVNGDNVFHPAVLRELLSVAGSLVMTVSRKHVYDEDDMKVLLKGDRVLKVGKTLPAYETNGESIGLVKFTDSGRDVLRDHLNTMVRSPQSRDMYWLAALQAMMDTANIVNYYEVPSTAWAEIDYQSDLEFVRTNLWRFRHSEPSHD